MVVIDEMLVIVEEVKFVFCCLVLEKWVEFIMEGGLDVVGNVENMKVVCE